MPDVQLDRPGRRPLRAFLAVPRGDGPWPGVVVVHEAFGLTEDTRDQAARLAAAGYLALAPDLFSDGGALRCLRSTFRALFSGQGQAYDDLELARRTLAERPDSTGRVGIVGFCMGGGFALMTAARGFDASAPNYGQLPKDPEEVLRGACPVVASYGARDPGLKGAAPRLERTLTELGVPHDVKEYPGVGHSFLNRHTTGLPLVDGPLHVLEKVTGLAYDGPSAEDAWRRILAFFAVHLGGDGATGPAGPPAQPGAGAS